MFNCICEVFVVGRLKCFEGGIGGYSYNLGMIFGVFVFVEGGSDDVVKDICMYIVVMCLEVFNVDELD